MRLSIVGCSGTFPSRDSGCSSYLVEHDGFRLLLDMGNGAVSGLARFGDVRRLDAVLLSHLHPDHCLDLVPYTYARKYHPEDPAAPVLPLYGPAGTLDQLAGAFHPPAAENVTGSYAVRTVEAGTREIGPFRVTLVPAAHPVECYAVRLEAGGRTLTYSADTGVCPALVDAARDADLFLCEASYVRGKANPTGVHLTGDEAGEHASRAGAGRLLLTHLVAWYDPARVLADAESTYAGPVELARAGAQYEL